MKKVMIILLLGSFILTLAACSDTSDDEKELKEFVTDYKSKLYNIENPNLLNKKHPAKVSQNFSRKIEPYVTNEVLDDLTLNRQLIIIPQIAQALGKKVKLQDILLEKVKENEDGSINYDYTMKIKYYDDESENIVKKNGELAAIDNDNGWKITRDWENHTKFEKEAMQQYLEAQHDPN